MSLYAVVDPATGKTVREYPTATDEQMQAALSAAEKAHREWSRGSTVVERAGLLSKVAELHTERRNELAKIIQREMGKPLDQSLGGSRLQRRDLPVLRRQRREVPGRRADRPGRGCGYRVDSPQLDRCADRHHAVELPLLPGRPVRGSESGTGQHHRAQTRTAVSGIGGGTSPDLHRRRISGGAYVNVYATNEQIADAIADPRVQGVSLTGSERAGAAVAEIAGRNLKKVVLELGGSDPFIVLSSDDLDATVKAAVEGRFENAGQACNAAKRFIIAEDLYDDFVGRFTAEVLATADELAPLSSVAAADRLSEQVQQAIAEGATLVSEGERKGAFFPPAVLTNVSRDSRTYREELFGPVATVYKVRSEDEAVELANDTPFGLGSYVFTTDPDQAYRVADSLEAGMVFVNAVGAEGVELPFGGVKRSGFGRELGKYGIDEFVNKKLIRVS